MHACYIITADAQDPRLLFALEIENTGISHAFDIVGKSCGQQ